MLQPARSCTARCFAGAVLLLATALAASARAQPATTTVLLCETADAEVLTRVRGQVQDLQVALQKEALDAAEREPQAVFVRLETEHAAALVCIEGDATAGYIVRVYSGADRSVRERSVAAPRPGDALAASAAHEAVAMVVRSEVSQLLAPRPAPAVPPAPQPTAAGTPPTAAQPPLTAASSDAEVSPAPPRSGLAPVRVSADWEAALSTGDVAHALAVHAEMELGALELGIAGTLGLPVTMADSQADARVARHGARGSVMLGAALGSYLHTAVGGHLALLVFQRSTRVRDGALTATGDAAAVCGGLGAQAVLRGRVLAQAGAELRMLLDVVPAAPRFVVNSGASSRVIGRAHVLQPALGLGLFAAF